jgi:predicted short-subunit dehydrogenase-like oxidoreductase (DUF2520 family)
MTFTRAPFPPSAEEALARLRGCVWALEVRDDALARSLEGLVAVLEGRVVRIGAADRVPYHIAAVLASNFVAALLGAAMSLWGDFETPAEGALPALLPLLRATVDNLEAVGLPAALTGPIARGDEGTVAAHLAWLDAHAGDDVPPTRAVLRDAYIALARIALPLAEAKGTLAPETAARLRVLLAEHER